MPKPNPLSQGLDQQAQPRVMTQPTRLVATSSRPAVRHNRVMVAGHFAPEVQTALKVVAAQERTTVQALLAEGINTVFAKRGKPEIAEFSAEV